MLKALMLVFLVPCALFGDLFDRNESQKDFNPYDYPSDVQPNNTRSVYYPEAKRLEQQGYQDDNSNQNSSYYYQQSNYQR
jgi:hypothetical protein